VQRGDIFKVKQEGIDRKLINKKEDTIGTIRVTLLCIVCKLYAE